MNGVRVAVHQSSSRSDRRKLFSITRSPSVAVVSEIAPMWTTASSLRPSSQRSQVGGRHEIGDLALGEIAPFGVMAEHVIDDDIGAPGLVEAGDDIRADKAGAAGDQSISKPLEGRNLCLSPVPQRNWRRQASRKR